uniref:Uncharacterized protein LOC105640592 n=1 Tax=Rhizophora mucronata TaxID=61149 RepID=A0A2P2KFQ8_RHIMU
MENSRAEADDQGSGWLEVKKKHRSGAKFSMQNWDGGFSGKNYSSYQLSQPSLKEKTANLSRKHRSQLAKKEAELPPADCGHTANFASVSAKYEDDRYHLNNSVVREHNKDCESPKLQFFVNDSNFQVDGTQKVLQNDKLLTVPKIKWGDLEDDVLVSHNDRNSRVDLSCSNIKDNNLVFRKPGQKSHLVSNVSCTNPQESKSVADVGVSPDSIMLLTSKEGQTYENDKGLCEISAADMEGPVMNGKTLAPNDGSVCKEMGGGHIKAVSDDWLSSTNSSGEDATRVVELQVSAFSPDVNEMEVSKLSDTNSNLVGILQDSKSESARKSGIEVSGEMRMSAKPQLPAVKESKICEQSGTNENLDLALIPLENELLMPEKSDSKDSREPEMVVEHQLPVMSGINKSPIFEVPTISGNPSAVAITQDCQSPALKKGEYEISGESTMTASVKDNGAPLDGGIHDELLEVQSMSALEESDASESKERFRERLWCFLFENLNRAVDELYLLCELECDVEQMKEAILVLEEAASDFRELTTRVQEFDNVKRSHSIDGAPVALKLDHCRPHALSWEVRRMTTSPHRAEILSSSLDTFKKIQEERAKKVFGNNRSTQWLESSNSRNVSSDNPKKSTRRTDAKYNARELEMKSRRQSGAADHTRGNPYGEKGNVELGRSNKVNTVKNGLDHRHQLPSSDANLSRLPSRENSTSFGTGKSKRELETEKVLHKKGKTLTENIIEKYKSTDHLKKQIPVFEKDKERRNSTSWKSLDAWKEKRNWEDILSSPFRVSSRMSHSPGMSRKSAERARILHDKLMSPEKKKKNAMDLKKEAEDKHARAMRIRNELENERAQKLQRTSEKLNRVNEWQAVRTMRLREGMYARHQRSESRHEAFLAQVVRRAGDESSKVNEVRFITSLNEENKKHMLKQKRQGWELRRAEKLQVIKTKQKEDLAREEAVLERRKVIEAEKLQRLVETQRKKEEAQVRREEERKASSAAREARAFEQLRRREERAKAQQEEAEMLAQKLAERLSESEQRRKFYLEQIRERASMDFRDQSSPFLRRSSNKEGQGRSTPSSSGEDYQENSVSVAACCAPATGTITLQHSQKRRIKKIRQRLMSLKYEFPEPLVGSENAGIGYRTTVGNARVKLGRWLQELKRFRQARKEGAASIGLIIAEIIKVVVLNLLVVQLPFSTSQPDNEDNGLNFRT